MRIYKNLLLSWWRGARKSYVTFRRFFSIFLRIRLFCRHFDYNSVTWLRSLISPYFSLSNLKMRENKTRIFKSWKSHGDSNEIGLDFGRTYTLYKIWKYECFPQTKFTKWTSLCWMTLGSLVPVAVVAQGILSDTLWCCRLYVQRHRR